MKKFIAVLFVLIMCLNCALAEEALRAYPSPDFDGLSAHYGFEISETGDYTVMSAKANAVEAFFYDRAAAIGGNGLAAFYTALEGSAESGICYPVLKVMHASAKGNDTRYVSFALDGVRYDFSCAAQKAKAGRFTVEELTVFLGSDGMRFIEKLGASDMAAIALYGSDMVVFEAEKRDTYANPKSELLGESLSALKLPEGSPDFGDYAFWTEAEEMFMYASGAKIAFESVHMNMEAAIEPDEDFAVIGKGAKGASIKEMQTLLKDKGYYQAALTTAVNALMIEAVKCAQMEAGLLPTGFGDVRLIAFLNGETVTNEEMGEAETEYDFVSKDAKLSVDRWWTAKSVAATVPQSRISVSDEGNIFLIADGRIESAALQAIALSWEAEAKLTYNGAWVFPAAIYAEAQNGKAFSQTLGMLSRTRLVIVSEVPEYLSEEEGEWKLTIQIGADEFDMMLK
ncbi:MAG: peptidoglycan-binding protein [Clostridia bacterium]|nr:peptidoglycan-binding protein [Clostridia bacterium]